MDMTKKLKDKEINEKVRKIEDASSEQDTKNKERELVEGEFALFTFEEELKNLEEEKEIFKETVHIIMDNFGRKPEKNEFKWEDVKEFEDLMKRKQNIIHRRQILRFDADIMIANKQIRNTKIQNKSLKTSLKMTKLEGK